ncbi:hypothetical protein WJX73_007650 [Symbiochloris irregularis]|uniref:Epoxide hydrolase N-terminal domain-containing protein n=1 Tax=Symbiochloris irregularis TaxID=706552 RepID=A0AAW1PC21_9CHLO
MASAPQRFEINYTAEELSDLQERLKRTRLPDQQLGVEWEQGTDVTYLKDLLHYWRTKFDWKAQERWLNTHYHNYKLRLRDQTVHFAHHPSPNPKATPLLLVHGWPGSFLEFHKILPKLQSDDTKGDYHVVIPSLPGYGFSSPPPRPGFDAVQIAALFDELMGALGYRQYVAQGGDWGGMIVFLLGQKHAQHCKAVHTNFPHAVPRWWNPWHMLQALNYYVPFAKQIPLLLSRSEIQGLDTLHRNAKHETGYQHIQRTKPQTLGYGLNDSPAGLAAWIVEKFHTWSDCHGDIESKFTKDELLTNICIYWFSGTITSSMRLYRESIEQWNVHMQGFCQTPTAIAKFPKDPFVQWPRAWIEATWNAQQYTEFKSGGHFAALEEPDLLVQDMDKFFSRHLRLT